MTARFSQSCENNKIPILEVLAEHFANVKSVLEIGSGTGQHCVYFAPRLPHLYWQSSDMAENHASILAWQRQVHSKNLGKPIELCIGVDDWPGRQADAVFTANTTHIMQPHEVKLMMQLVAENLPTGGVFCQYGPFNFNSRFTSDSNQQFDQYLKDNGYGGIRDIDELIAWGAGLKLLDKVTMPANNFMLVWLKASDHA